MDKALIRSLAEFLNKAELEKQEVFRLTIEHPDLTMEDGYEIQREIVRIKLQSGNKIVGMKMGLTSEAKMKQMKIDNPLYGHLFDYMVVRDKGTISMKELIHPRVESEIAVILKKDLVGPGVTKEQVMDAVEYVFPVMEIVDSRFENFNFKLPDVVADNSSSSRFIVGETMTKPDGLRLEELNVSLVINGEVRDTGTGAAVLGHPAVSVAMLANMLSQYNEVVKAGDIILTGGITQAVMLKAGDSVTTKIDVLGEVHFQVTE